MTGHENPSAADALRALLVPGGHSKVQSTIARAAMLLENQAAEIERLTGWKAEAAAVMAEWNKVWDALGQPGPLGRSTAANSLAEVERLRAYVAGLEMACTSLAADRDTAVAASLRDLRSPFLGSWDDWTREPLGGYNSLPVYARAALAHLHGRHADGLYSYCPICEAAERAERPEAECIAEGHVTMGPDGPFHDPDEGPCEYGEGE